MSSSSGGAVYIKSGTSASSATIYYLLIERSTFISCEASYGGAIDSVFGNNVLHNVCGNDCNADNNCGFALIDGYDSTSTYTKNYVIQSSVANCVANYYTMDHFYGNIQYKSVNLSKNNADSYSAIRCRTNQKDENTDYGISISYSSFSNNTASNDYCIYLYYDTSNANANKYEINMSNIIYNIPPVSKLLHKNTRPLPMVQKINFLKKHS